MRLAVPSDLQVHTLAQVGNRHLIIEIHHCLYLEHLLNWHVISYVPSFKGDFLNFFYVSAQLRSQSTLFLDGTASSRTDRISL